MPLQHKYHPKTLDDVIGNASAVKTIRSMLSRKPADISHVFLFVGPAGCGKTTLAQITAREIGCTGLDFMELNTADFRGIDTARNITRNSRLSAISEGGKRGWFMDECHQLSGPAQEALLKTLEHPPEHAFFFLATTEPESLKPTFKRRCTLVTVSTLKDDDVAAYLDRIVEKEDAPVPEDVIDEIVDNSFGSLGVALSMLDTVIDLEERDMLEALRTMKSVQSTALELCQAIWKKAAWTKIGKILSTLDADPEQLRRAVLGYCNSILVKSDNPHAYLTMLAFREPFFQTGKAGLTMACYEAVNGDK